MKCVKTIFKDILFYAPNWSDEQETSYGCFSGFLGPLGCSKEKFKCLGGFLGAFRSVNKIQSCALMTASYCITLNILFKINSVLQKQIHPHE